jgi:hypothetical protein
MAKTSKKRRSAMSKRPRIPMTLVVPALVDAQMIYEGAKAGFSPASMNNLQYYFTGTGAGISGVDLGRVVNSYGKSAVGAAVHIGANKLGINKQIAKFTRGYITL